MLGRAGFEAWPLSRLLTVSSFGVGLCGLYNRSTQTLLQKSPAYERHLPLRLLSRLSQVCELHPGASHISRFPAPPAGFHGRLPACALSCRSVPEPVAASHHSVPFLSQGRLAVIFFYFILLFFLSDCLCKSSEGPGE